MVESDELHKLLFQKYFCGRASPAQPGAGPGLGLRGRCHHRDCVLTVPRSPARSTARSTSPSDFASSANLRT
jgi:hypothetical protein